MKRAWELSITSNVLIVNAAAAATAALVTAWLATSVLPQTLPATAIAFVAVNLLLGVPANLAVIRRFSRPVNALARLMDAGHPAYADRDAIERLGRQGSMEPHLRHLVDSCCSLLATVREDRIMMEQISLTDPLTEVGNSRALHQGLEAEISRSRAQGGGVAAPFSVVVLDLDRFKEINDTLGHLTGDEVLRDMADLLRQNVRKNDTALASPEHYRFGGDEFVIIAPETSTIKASMLAERLNKIISSYPFQTHDGRLLGDTSIGPIRASIGTACYPDEGTTPDELLELADKRMYEVKEERRRKQYWRAPAFITADATRSEACQ